MINDNDMSYVNKYIMDIFSLYIKNDYDKIDDKMFRGNTCCCGTYNECSKFIEEEILNIDEITSKFLKALTLYCNEDRKLESKVISKIIRSWMWYLDTNCDIKEMNLRQLFIHIDRNKCNTNKRIKIHIDKKIWKKFVEKCKNYNITTCVMFRNSLEYFLVQQGGKPKL